MELDVRDVAVQFPVEAINLSHVQSVHTGSGVQHAIFSMDVKWLACKSSHWLPSDSDVKNEWSHNSIHICDVQRETVFLHLPSTRSIWSVNIISFNVLRSTRILHFQQLFPVVLFGSIGLWKRARCCHFGVSCREKNRKGELDERVVH
jgi:hypothetical protein